MATAHIWNLILRPKSGGESIVGRGLHSGKHLNLGFCAAGWFATAPKWMA